MLVNVPPLSKHEYFAELVSPSENMLHAGISMHFTLQLERVSSDFDNSSLSVLMQFPVTGDSKETPGNDNRKNTGIV